ncbi:MAG: hypothetical protein JWM27_219 [Gemmatimonadetes bacterium]|nr:hypothetical protein [Gemmatimonadota bacterium]
MSDRIDIHLREAKPSPGGGIFLAVASWIKKHVPFILRPVDYVEARIDVDRARAELLRNEARKLGAEADLISARAAAVRIKTMMHLTDHSVSALAHPSAPARAAALPDEAMEALEEAIRRVEALHVPVDMRVSGPNGELPPEVSDATAGPDEMESN